MRLFKHQDVDKEKRKGRKGYYQENNSSGIKSQANRYGELQTSSEWQILEIIRWSICPGRDKDTELSAKQSAAEKMSWMGSEIRSFYW